MYIYYTIYTRAYRVIVAHYHHTTTTGIYHDRRRRRRRTYYPPLTTEPNPYESHFRKVYANHRTLKELPFNRKYHFEYEFFAI